MCGIVGYFSLADQVDFDLPRAVARARDQMVHRGPDSAGLFVSPDGRCVLGSRRLSIRDLTPAGNQPVSNEDGTVWVVFNGEIYNAEELREALEKRGHRFRSRCDTEVLVHLYEDHGPDLVDQIDGMFSMVLYDQVRQRLFGARDRIGVKPLYYSLSATRFAFASEAKALLALPDVARTPRLEELPAYLTFACVPGPATLHRDIDKLEPGTRFELSGNGTFRKQRFWQFPPSIDDRSDPRELEAALHTALRRAVSKRNIADVRVGATMSGGIDSGLVVAHMSESLGAPVPTFTIGYPGDEASSASDLHFARILARTFTTDSHELKLDAAAFEPVLEDLPALSDDPNGSPSMAALLHVAMHCRRNGVRVMQIGEGGDELFAGYRPAYRLWRAQERLSALQRLLRPEVARFLMRRIGDSIERVLDRSPRLSWAVGARLEPLRRYASNEMPYWGHGTVFTKRQRRRFLGQATNNTDPHVKLLERMECESGFHQRPYLDQLALIDLLLELPERLLSRADRATMRHGVEARVPFLDPEVLRVAFRIPAALRAASAKGFLRTYARGKLPAAIVNRRKQGFPTAPGVFLSPAVTARIRECVLSKRFLEMTGMQRAAVVDLVGAAHAGRPATLSPVWTLYVLSLWAHHWV